MDSEPREASAFELNQPTIISLLYLGGFVTGISALVGVVLAHAWQADNRANWAASHFTYLIRTFWLGLVGFVIAGVLSLVLIGLLLFPVVGVWVGVRSVLSLMRAQKREAMPEPRTWLF